MKFCSQCGAELVLRVPPEDFRERHVCTGCSTVHYQNPRVVAGCIPEWDGRVLLCRRAIEPRAGYWNLPAGFMELGETTAEAAARETGEEANARIEVGGLYAVFNLPHISQVYFMYRARLLDLDFSAGHETAEARLFELDAVPWTELAFPTVRHTLQLLGEDRGRGSYRLHTGDIVRTEAGYEFRAAPPG